MGTTEGEEMMHRIKMPLIQLKKQYIRRSASKAASMFIFAEKRLRSPLQTQFIEAIQHAGTPFEIVWFNDPHTNVVDVFRAHGYPDIVYVGVGFANRSLIFALNGAIKRPFTVIEIADYECFTTEKDNYQQFYKQLQSVKIDLFVSKNVDIPASTNKLKSYIASVDKFRNSRLVFSPWSIDMNRYAHTKVKDIDVSFICTITKGWCYHNNRLKIAEVLRTLDCNCYIGNVYGDQYIDILQRSKIFVVETSMRRGMSQKYLEGTACGCMLIGEMPDYPMLFKDKVTMVSADATDLKQKITKYLKNDKSRVKIAAEAKKSMTALCSIETARNELQTVILDEYRRSRQYGRR